mgnify:CR=1 FL=1
MLFLLILASVLFFITLGVMVYISDSFFGGLDFSSSGDEIQEVIKIVNDRKLSHGRFYDLGSARGNFAVKVARVFPQLRVWGIDDNGYRTAIARVRSAFLKNIAFVKEDIFSTDVSDADVVYLYLPQELMPKLQVKLQNELKHGAIVITNKVSFFGWQPNIKLSSLFIYQMA